MRRRYRYDRERGEMVEIQADSRPSAVAPFIQPDIPGYQSPVTGLWVEGRKARREDLRRSGSRPWEGMEAEKKEAARRQDYIDQAHDRRLTEHTARAYHQLSPAKRRILEGR